MKNPTGLPPVQNFETLNSPLRAAYEILGANTPFELSRAYVKAEQVLFKDRSWDYDDVNQVQNIIRGILESVDEANLLEEEIEWRNEILWFWYHHAVSIAGWKKDKEKQRNFSEKALQYQGDNPNMLTRIMYLLVHDRIAEAEAWMISKAGDADQETALEMLKNYKQLGMLWPDENL